MLVKTSELDDRLYYLTSASFEILLALAWSEV